MKTGPIDKWAPSTIRRAAPASLFFFSCLTPELDLTCLSLSIFFVGFSVSFLSFQLPPTYHHVGSETC